VNLKRKAWRIADAETRQQIVDNGRRYAERYHSSQTEHLVLGEALELLSTPASTA